MEKDRLRAGPTVVSCVVGPCSRAWEMQPGVHVVKEVNAQLRVGRTGG